MNTYSQFLPPFFNHDGPLFQQEAYHNQRAKLRNTVSDLRWYTFRLMVRYQIPNVTYKNAFELCEKHFSGQVVAFNHISDMLNVIATATPENADGRVQRTWIKMHGILDPILSRQNT